MSDLPPRTPFEQSRLQPSEMVDATQKLLLTMQGRRSVRDFATDSVPREVVERCIEIANTAPSGANRQPWHFVLVGDPKVKQEIRVAAEKEEREFYSGRAPEEWLQALAPLETDEHKPFLETAPFLIAIFAQSMSADENGKRRKNYYVNESVGIATGFLITALQSAGLSCLTHTPAPMRFLNEILGRPRQERPYLILVVGHAAEGCTVPAITKKSLAEVLTVLD